MGAQRPRIVGGRAGIGDDSPLSERELEGEPVGVGVFMRSTAIENVPVAPLLGNA